MRISNQAIEVCNVIQLEDDKRKHWYLVSVNEYLSEDDDGIHPFLSGYVSRVVLRYSLKADIEALARDLREELRPQDVRIDTDIETNSITVYYLSALI